MTKTKKQKVDLNELCDSAWEHWQNYPETSEEDVDELIELKELVQPHLSSNKTPKDLLKVRSRVDLLPFLINVASAALAEEAMSKYLAFSPKQREDEAVWEEICQHLVDHQASSSSSIINPSCWSMAANFARVTQRLVPSRVIQWYLHAADNCRTIRQQAIDLLDADDDESFLLDEDTKAWIESIVLNQMVGVESIDIDEGENDNNDHEAWSLSTVEATSRFMAAMLLSSCQQHDAALKQLLELDVTHRLHPNVWIGLQDKKQGSASKSESSSYYDDNIRLFSTDEGLLPTRLYQRLCEVFGPNAPYWEETDYSNRGYYSYFMDYRPNEPPQHVLEHAIVQCLLPHAKSLLAQKGGDASIVGFEWWVHTRDTNANLGHNLHFDTDEAVLNAKGEIEHPVYSSVLYLTGNAQHAGATIVMSQTPDSTEVANVCYRNVPVQNSFLVFPGNLLHGVLPCPGCNYDANKTASIGDSLSGSADDTVAPQLPDMAEVTTMAAAGSLDDASSNTSHRLTLMVGFWTRRVPDHVETKLYGPCGPMPPAEDYQWVQQLQEGYSDGTKNTEYVASVEAVQGKPVPCVSPAWETIKSQGKLQIPHGILDHRYFVKDAPQCFRSSLFEKDEEDECEEEDGAVAEGHEENN